MEKPKEINRTRKARINCNEQAFDELTPESAYWLGFLYADGNIYKNKDGNIRLTFCLAAKDSVAVHAFKRFMEADGGLYFRPKTKALSFSVTNKHLGERLIELGVVPRKSAKIRYPKIINELGLDESFIRGYINGDGWVGIHKHGKTKQPCIGVASNRDFLNEMMLVVKKELGIPLLKIYHKKDGNRDPYFGFIQ